MLVERYSQLEKNLKNFKKGLVINNNYYIIISVRLLTRNRRVIIQSRYINLKIYKRF